MSMDVAICNETNETALPDDPVILKQMIIELLATLKSERRERDQIASRLDLLLRRLYGPKSEKIDPNQLLLFDEPPEIFAAATEPKPAVTEEKPADKRKGHGRKSLPKQLPRVRVERDVPEAERCCPGCGELRQKFGEEVTETLDYRPSSLFVRQEARPKYACKRCEGHVVIAPKSAQPIDKGIPGPGLLAYITVSKHADHLPLNRLEGIIQRHGVEISRKTMGGWMPRVAELVSPIYQEMIRRVLESMVIHTDDTPVKVLDPKLDHARTGRFWVYLGDRSFPYCVFDYTPTHEREGPATFLKDYKGYLQADAFNGYDGIYVGSLGEIVEVACWAHARRKFHDAKTNDAARSHQMLAFIQRLYAIEREANELAEQKDQKDDLAKIRLRLRTERAKPILESLHAWLRTEKTNTLPKSAIGQAISYALSNWEALNRYVESGVLAIDNNAAERALRQIAVGRNNWTFLGGDQGGRTAAILFSMTGTCKLLDIDPYAYMQDVLDRIPTHPPDRIIELLPDHWQRLREASSISN